MAAEPSIPVLLGLLRDGRALVPASWALEGPERAGLWWRVAGTSEVVATPTLVRLAAELPNEAEAAGTLLATEPRYRDAWLGLEAARLRDLGERERLTSLCDAIDAVGPAAAALRERLARVRLAPTGQGDVELAAFGASADQPMAALPLRRALASTAPLVEGGLAIPQGPLAALNDEDPAVSWCPGRLLQAPGAAPGTAGAFVLSGHLPECHGEAMPWVLGTPWVTLLAMLVFTAEAWAAERRGGVQIELPLAAVQTFGAPPRVDVVVTLPDGREVLCGSLGELCLRTVDALGMAVVPPPNVSQLDAALAPVVTALLRVGVWIWQPDARPRYAISDAFSRACYGQAGTPLRVHGDHLFEALRSTAMAWARSRSDGVEASP